MNASTDTAYRNPTATEIVSDSSSMFEVTLKWLFEGAGRKPLGPVPVVKRTRASFAAPRADELRVTWLGWASVLVHIDGIMVLTDPMLSRRASPVGFAGPGRLHDVPCGVDDLPDIDVVVISHDHYDHLDRTTIRALARKDPLFAVPRGVGDYLRDWGVADGRIVELGWWEKTEVAGVTFQATPARHFSGRGLFDRNRTLWATWVIRGPSHRVFFGGDTGLFDGLEHIGERSGPFDVTLLPIGAYDVRWADIHLTPEEAIEANRLLGGRAILPIHFATFDMALHTWSNPMERFLWEAYRTDTRIFTPVPGQTVDPLVAAEAQPWWRIAETPCGEDCRGRARRFPFPAPNLSMR